MVICVNECHDLMAPIVVWGSTWESTRQPQEISHRDLKSQRVFLPHRRLAYITKRISLQKNLGYKNLRKNSKLCLIRKTKTDICILRSGLESLPDASLKVNIHSQTYVGLYAYRMLGNVNLYSSSSNSHPIKLFMGIIIKVQISFKKSATAAVFFVFFTTNELFVEETLYS